jgi:hypothetical protein
MTKPSVLVISPVRVISSYFGGKSIFSSNGTGTDKRKKGVTVVIGGIKVKW